MFSIYLSNKENVPGDVSFGGFDLDKFAKKGSKESDIAWINQATNDAYWAVDSGAVKFGKNEKFIHHKQ